MENGMTVAQYETLNKLLKGQIIKGKYDVVVGGSDDKGTVAYKAGVAKEEFAGRCFGVKISKDGNLYLTMRQMYRRTRDGAFTEEEKKDAQERGLAFTKEDGEFQFRSLRLEGLRWNQLKVFRGGRGTVMDIPFRMAPRSKEILVIKTIAHKPKTPAEKIARCIARRIGDEYDDVKNTLLKMVRKTIKKNRAEAKARRGE